MLLCSAPTAVDACQHAVAETSGCVCAISINESSRAGGAQAAQLKKHHDWCIEITAVQNAGTAHAFVAVSSRN
jgi:hypothetical protein